MLVLPTDEAEHIAPQQPRDPAEYRPPANAVFVAAS